MNLQPDPATPGLWVNPAWQPGMPGSFAVVIGVSAYPHLDGGTEPAPDHGQAWITETRTLGQLYVSALTAWRFFDWLANDYLYPEAPIAKCWLLLSPTDAERAHEPRIMEHAAEPSVAGCTAAIDQWYAAMRDMPQPAQASSRAFFFFSGHGLQILHDKHLLLPSDFLGGVVPKPQNALRTGNLIIGLAPLPIQDRLFLIDACRNDFNELRGKSGRGLEILPELEAAASHAGIRLDAVLEATATALQAWQPTDPATGLSLFGHALLDGLKGRPDIELARMNGHHGVKLFGLQGYTGERVMELMNAYQSSKVQRVRLGGTAIENVLITELATTPPAPLEGTPVPPGPPATARPMRSASARAADLRSRLAETFVARSDVAPELQHGAWSRDYALGHDLFGSERITAIWQQNLKVRRLATRRPLAIDELRLYRVGHDSERQAYRLDLSIGASDPRGFWLEVSGVGDDDNDLHGVLLPADRSAGIVYRLAADMRRLDGPTRWGARIARLDAWLAPSTSGGLGEAASLWRTYASADLGQAVSEFEAGQLRERVRDKRISPLAATIAALVLLRANRLDLIEDWLRNLADWFPHLPDGAVLWAEQVWRQEQDREHAIREVTKSLLRLETRGLPFTGEALSYAATLVERLRRARRLVPEELHDRLATLDRRLQRAIVFFRPNGLFASYAGFKPRQRGLFLPPAHRRLDAPPPSSAPLLPPDIELEQHEDGIQVGDHFLPRN